MYKNYKKFISFLLVLAMFYSLLPAETYAFEQDSISTGIQHVTEQMDSSEQSDGLTLEHTEAVGADLTSEQSEVDKTLQELITNIIGKYRLINDGTDLDNKYVMDDWIAMNLGMHDSPKALSPGQSMPYGYNIYDHISTIMKAKFTDPARLIMTITAIGIDASKLSEFGNGTKEFTDSQKTVINNLVDYMLNNNSRYTINGPIYALIALDMGNYSIPEESLYNREKLLDIILEADWTKGDFKLFGLDMVAMAMQAVAPYQNDAVYGSKVSGKLNEGLQIIISQMDAATFLFPYYGNVSSAASETSAQVICALAAMGIDANTDPRFSDGKGNSVLTALLSFANAEKTGFKHLLTSGISAMPTYQGFYAILWYNTFVNNGQQPYSLYYNRYDFSTKVLTIQSLSNKLDEIKAKQLEKEGFTESSFEALIDAIEQAESIVQKDSPTEDEIKKALDALSLAFVNLVPIELSETIKQAKLYAEEDYTADSYAILQGAIAKAEAALTSSDYDEVASIQQYLIASMNHLVSIKELKSTIEEAKALKEAEYTAVSWKVLANAIIEAEKIFTKPNASKQEVDFSIDEMAMAISGLVVHVRPDVNTMTVSFTLIGDSKHDMSSRHVAFQTWIPTFSLTVAKNATVYDVFNEALSQYNLAYNETQINYIGGIKAPNSLGGHWLYEFDNGPNSGWMYKVNGTHPSLGLREYILNDGDVITWHYTDDYTKEEGSDKWNDSIGPSETDPAIAPTATINGETASVSLDLHDMQNAIESAKRSGTAIVVTPLISRAVSSVQVALKKNALSAIADQTNAPLTIQTPVGHMTLPNDVLDSITSQAAGDMITVSLETVDKEKLTAEQQKVVGSSTIYDISIVSGSIAITSFDGKSLKLSLPYKLKNSEDPSNVTVWYLNDAGVLEQMSGSYDKTTGYATFETTHLSYYVVGYVADWVNPFADVKSTDWFYNTVKYVSQNNLMSGTSAVAFAPSDHMTRAMLVTVLYRIEGEPVVNGINDFADVASGQWYSDAVTWASSNNIVSGYDAGLFGTNDSVTREQLAVILMNYAKYKKNNVTKTADITAFTDHNGVHSWATEAVNWAVSEGLLTGITPKTLEPVGLVTRSQMATVLMRFMENVAK